MSEPAETRESLLIRLGDPACHEAWNEFSLIYRPMVVSLARRAGLQANDAEDVAQQVMVSVMRVIRDWRKDPVKGRFRGWLTTVTRNAIRNAITRTPRDRGAGDTKLRQLIESQASEDQLDEVIEAEFLRSIFRQAAEIVQAEFESMSWKAFWLTTVEGVEIANTAAELSMTRGAVYSARSRIMKRLQAVAKELLLEDSHDE